MVKKIVFALPFLAGSLSFATTVKSVTFQGLIHLSPQIANEIADIRIGEEFSQEVGNKAIQKLFKQGYFSDVWIEDDGGDIIINVKEKPTIAFIDINGVSDDDEKNIKSILGINKGMVYDNSTVKIAKTRIVKYFEAKGYFDTVVEEISMPLNDEDTSLKVTFQINRGESIIIKSVTLAGAKDLDYDDVEPALVNKQRESLGWMWGFNDGKLKLEALPSEADRVRDKYYQKGYMDATISNPFLKFYPDTYGADIVYKVEEGNKYTISSIDIQSNEDILDLNRLKKDLLLEEGDTFNADKLRRDMASIGTKFADLGYAFVKVFPDVTQDRGNSKTAIIYKVVPNEKVSIRNIIIGGNERTADHVIRRDMYVSEGEYYSKTALQDSLGSLKRTGYFDDVKMTEKRVSQDEVDIYVNVKEAPTGSIKGGVGYGSAQGLMFDVGISDKNIFGSGMIGGISGNRSDDKISGRISLKNPRVYDSPYSLGGSIYAEDSNWNSYDERTYGFSLDAGRKIGRNTHVSLGYVLAETTLSNMSEHLKEIGYKEGPSIKSALTPSIVYDTTDDYYLPRHGLIASSSFEYAGLGGDEKYMKSLSNFKYFYGLEDHIGYDVILRYKARLRYAWDKGNLPIGERLYLGGVSSVRGFTSRSIGPKKKGYEYGGKESFNNSVEASFPLISRLKMRWALFYDYGMLGIDKFDEYQRSSYGANIEWISPLGAINLIFAKPIDEQIGDSTSSFEFTIGRQF